MADTNTGMEAGEMKQLLIKSKKEPLNCAFATGPNTKLALLMLHRVKAPKAIVNDIKKEFSSAKTERWGTAEVDVDDDPKLVKFRVNKGGGGYAKKLKKTLLGTGFTKVIIFADDGSPPETANEQDDDDAVATSGDVETTAEQTEEEALLDAAALTTAFRALAARIAQIDQTKRAPLLTLAAPIPDSLKNPDLKPAAAQIEALRAAIEEAGQTDANATAGTDAAAATYAKSKQIWISTRGKVESEIERLRASIAATYSGEPVAVEIESSFRSKVEPVLAKLDLELAEKLEAMAKPTDAAERTKLLGEARGVMQRYAAYVTSEPIIGDLDNNPFAPLAIKQTVTGTLAALAQAVK